MHACMYVCIFIYIKFCYLFFICVCVCACVHYHHSFAFKIQSSKLLCNILMIWPTLLEQSSKWYLQYPSRLYYITIYIIILYIFSKILLQKFCLDSELYIKRKSLHTSYTIRDISLFLVTRKYFINIF